MAHGSVLVLMLQNKASVSTMNEHRKQELVAGWDYGVVNDESNKKVASLISRNKFALNTVAELGG